jgi:hypothetical protein
MNAPQWCLDLTCAVRGHRLADTGDHLRDLCLRCNRLLSKNPRLETLTKEVAKKLSRQREDRRRPLRRVGIA